MELLRTCSPVLRLARRGRRFDFPAKLYVECRRPAVVPRRRGRRRLGLLAKLPRPGRPSPARPDSWVSTGTMKPVEPAPACRAPRCWIRTRFNHLAVARTGLSIQTLPCRCPLLARRLSPADDPSTRTSSPSGGDHAAKAGRTREPARSRRGLLGRESLWRVLPRPGSSADAWIAVGTGRSGRRRRGGEQPLSAPGFPDPAPMRRKPPLVPFHLTHEDGSGPPRR